MGDQGGRNELFRKILVSGYPGQSGRPDTGKPPANVFYAHFLDEPGIYYCLGGVWAAPSLDLIK